MPHLPQSHKKQEACCILSSGTTVIHLSGIIVIVPSNAIVNVMSGAIVIILPRCGYLKKNCRVTVR